MDKSALITLLANAAVTVLTTVIVTRITLGKPAFVSGSSIKSALRRYGSLLFAAFGLVINAYAVIRFMTNGLAIRKFDVLFVPINSAGAIMFAVSIVGLLAIRRARA